MQGSEVNLWQKSVRAKVIRDHLDLLRTKRCVCFSSGNSAMELLKVGLDVIYVGEKSWTLAPKNWFSYSAIAQIFGVFDATSGHLPWPLMHEIAMRMRAEQPVYKGPIDIPTGSGETIVCLFLAYPDHIFRAERGASPEVRYNENAPLNGLVSLLMGLE